MKVFYKHIFFKLKKFHLSYLQVLSFIEISSNERTSHIKRVNILLLISKREKVRIISNRFSN